MENVLRLLKAVAVYNGDTLVENIDWDDVWDAHDLEVLEVAAAKMTDESITEFVNGSGGERILDIDSRELDELSYFVQEAAVDDILMTGSIFE